RARPRPRVSRRAAALREMARPPGHGARRRQARRRGRRLARLADDANRGRDRGGLRPSGLCHSPASAASAAAPDRDAAVRLVPGAGHLARRAAPDRVAGAMTHRIFTTLSMIAVGAAVAIVLGAVTPGPAAAGSLSVALASYERGNYNAAAPRLL